MFQMPDIGTAELVEDLPLVLQKHRRRNGHAIEACHDDASLALADHGAMEIPEECRRLLGHTVPLAGEGQQMAEFAQRRLAVMSFDNDIIRVCLADRPPGGWIKLSEKEILVFNERQDVPEERGRRPDAFNPLKAAPDFEILPGCFACKSACFGQQFMQVPVRLTERAARIGERQRDATSSREPTVDLHERQQSLRCGRRPQQQVARAKPIGGSKDRGPFAGVEEGGVGKGFEQSVPLRNLVGIDDTNRGGHG